MAGVLPSTGYLLIYMGTVVGEFENLTAISYHLGISIDKEGNITFMDNKVGPSYGLDHWGELGAIKDWSRCYLRNTLSSDYKIYRYLS